MTDMLYQPPMLNEHAGKVGSLATYHLFLDIFMGYE